ncbi:MAG: hypothetical protein ACRCU1_05725 [Alsobacter sp.]
MTAVHLLTNPFSEEAPFEMANLRPEKTGLPFVVWISQRGSAQHDVRIKLSRTPQAGPDWITVTVRPVDDLSGTLRRREMDMVRAWIGLNRDTLVAYWNGEIAYTEEVIARLAPLPKA